MSTTFTIELERENDGRRIADVSDLSGVLSYGQTRTEAIARVQALALRVLAERLERDGWSDPSSPFMMRRRSVPACMHVSLDGLV